MHQVHVYLNTIYVGDDQELFPLCFHSVHSGHVEIRDFLRVLRLKACNLSEKVSYQVIFSFNAAH